MPTKCGAFSHNFEESKVTGLGRDSYYPSRTPNKYTSSQKPIRVLVDENHYDSIGTEGNMLQGGFSGPVSRNSK